MNQDDRLSLLHSRGGLENLSDDKLELIWDSLDPATQTAYRNRWKHKQEGKSDADDGSAGDAATDAAQ